MHDSPFLLSSVMYPNTPGARFNHEYYRDKHMPLVKARMGDSKYYTVDKGLAGGAPGAPATYVGMCHIFSAIPCRPFKVASVPAPRRSWATSRTTPTSRR